MAFYFARTTNYLMFTYWFTLLFMCKLSRCKLKYKRSCFTGAWLVSLKDVLCSCPYDRRVTEPHSEEFPLPHPLLPAVWHSAQALPFLWAALGSKWASLTWTISRLHSSTNQARPCLVSETKCVQSAVPWLSIVYSFPFMMSYSYVAIYLRSQWGTQGD